MSWGGEGIGREIIYLWETQYFLDVLNTEAQDVENSKPVFDPDFHTELIIKDEYEDVDSGNVETYIKTVKNTHTIEIIPEK